MALTTQLGEVMQQQTRVRSGGKLANLFKNNGLVSAFTLATLLVLSACGGGGSTIVENDLSDTGPDRVSPTLVSVSIKMAKDANPKPNGAVKLGQAVRIDIEASEALMKPSITIAGVAADEIGGKIGDWYAIRTMTDLDIDGEVADINGRAANLDEGVIREGDVLRTRPLKPAERLADRDDGLAQVLKAIALHAHVAAVDTHPSHARVLKNTILNQRSLCYRIHVHDQIGNFSPVSNALALDRWSIPLRATKTIDGVIDLHIGLQRKLQGRLISPLYDQA